jgi:hypothetical protein
LSVLPGWRPTGLPSARRRASPARMRSDRRWLSCCAIQPANATSTSWTSGDPFSQPSLTLMTVQPRSRNWRMIRSAPFGAFAGDPV